eukprot:7963695-Pyramimonas_sp.AAC.1
MRVRLRRMRPRKAAGEGGIAAELQRHGNQLLLTMLSCIVAAVLRPGRAMPEYWKASSMRVFVREGRC